MKREQTQQHNQTRNRHLRGQPGFRLKAHKDEQVRERTLVVFTRTKRTSPVRIRRGSNQKSCGSMAELPKCRPKHSDTNRLSICYLCQSKPTWTLY